MQALGFLSAEPAPAAGGAPGRRSSMVERASIVAAGASAPPISFDVRLTKALGRVAPRTLEVSLCQRTVSTRAPGANAKVYPCSAFVRMEKLSSGNGLVVSFQEGSKLRSRQYAFDTAEQRNKFQSLVQSVNECGAQAMDIFTQLDVSGAGELDVDSVRQGLEMQGVFLTDEELQRMFSRVDVDASSKIDFNEFFHLFQLAPTGEMTTFAQDWLGLAGDDAAAAAAAGGAGGAGGEAAGPQVPDPPLLPGEVVMNREDNASYSCHVRGMDAVRGTLFLTPYRIVFHAYTSPRDGYAQRMFPAGLSEISIPLLTVAKLEVPRNNPCAIHLQCKDTRLVRFEFGRTAVFVTKLAGVMETLTFPRSFELAFAFSFSMPGVTPATDGWAVYDLMAEYRRQGILDLPQRWRVVDQSATEYELSPTYPSHIVVPTQLDDDELREVVRYRSRGRLPSVTWVHPQRGCALVRCSQPQVGVGGHRCAADERLLDLYRVAGNEDEAPTPRQRQQQQRSVYVVDARKYLAATGNQIKGKGVENVANYNSCKVLFMNIENIHTMRNSLRDYADILLPGGVNDDDPHYLSKLESSGWPRHVRLVLAASVKIAKVMCQEGSSVVVHCSDGWDRTSQLCAVAQMLMDPYFRTIRGFAVVVEKDWCSFGHKFQDRCGHGENNPTNQERSPVFVQFLDCVAQLIGQFPHAFEFTEELLVFVADHVFSGLFGNFFTNTERERVGGLRVKERTTSLWSYVLKHAGKFANADYQPHEGLLWPAVSAKRVRVWERYYCRFDVDMHPRGASNAAWVDDQGATEECSRDASEQPAAPSTSAAQGLMTELQDANAADENSSDDEDEAPAAAAAAPAPAPAAPPAPAAAARPAPPTPVRMDSGKFAAPPAVPARPTPPPPVPTRSDSGSGAAPPAVPTRGVPTPPGAGMAKPAKPTPPPPVPTRSDSGSAAAPPAVPARGGAMAKPAKPTPPPPVPSAAPPAVPTRGVPTPPGAAMAKPAKPTPPPPVPTRTDSGAAAAPPAVPARGAPAMPAKPSPPPPVPPARGSPAPPARPSPPPPVPAASSDRRRSIEVAAAAGLAAALAARNGDGAPPRPGAPPPPPPRA